MKSSPGRDVVSGAALAVLAVAYFLATGELPVGSGEPGPRFFPRLLALALSCLGAAIAIRGVRQLTSAVAEKTEAVIGLRPALLALATALTIALVPATGFAPAAFLFAVVTSRLFGGGLWSSLAIAAVATTAVHWLFVHGLSVTFP